MFEVYIHVPFCLQRCGYCDFNTYTNTHFGYGASRTQYAATAIHEMELVKRWQDEQGIDQEAVSSVFFGGGTPTVLDAGDLVALLHAVKNLWGLTDDAEITTGANPDTVDAAYIDTLAAAGFTRISLGMQSAVPHVLRVLDRTHTPANIVSAVRCADHAGLQTSVDLIYGAPGESVDDWRQSLDAALDLQVHHISAYALTVAARTRMGRRIAAGTLNSPDDDDEATKYEIADTVLSSAGLSWYEISNWSHQGYECRHNMGYWNNVDWAGIGAGAHSHYHLPHQPKADGEPVVGLRSWDIAHPRAWAQAIADNKLPWQGKEYITADDHGREMIMLQLRVRSGLDITQFPSAMRRKALVIIEELVKDGLLTVSDHHAVATRKGRLLNDTIITRLFDLYDE